ncbi:hypothetical protein CsSME_00009881 [Camellia sinensis var. sinensis]
MICTQFGATIKIFRSDNGGEYIDSGLGQYFSTHGIIHQTSCTNTPQQNGVAERKNRHLLDMARCMCFFMNSYFLSSPVSPSSLPGEPWYEVSPVPPMVEVSPEPPMVEMSPVPPMIEPVVLAPPSSTGTIEPTVTKNKDGHVYIRDIDRKQVNWIHGTVSATPLPSPASDESLGNFESRESIDLDVPIAKRKGDALAISEWKLAMIEEMKALRKNGTWELTELPTGKRPVGCKWVYTVKHKADGSIERYKARLVAKGFTQTYGIDYQETFAPVAKMNSVRVLLSLAANLDWPLYQFDVKNAFLHGDLEEEVYMDIPPGFENHQTEGKVCKLRKSLYGNDSGEIPLLKKYLAKEFEIKDLGSLKYFLGIEVARSKDGIFISQRKYFMHAPHQIHFEAVMRILRYLKSAPGKGLFFFKV